MNCPVCKADNAATAKFCCECGLRLEFQCPYCTAPTAAGAKFCTECGSSLDFRCMQCSAVNRPGEQEFPAEAQNLIQALGRVAGLQDARADRGGLFLFRAQDPARTAQLLPAGRKAEANVVYHLDLRDPNAFFVAGSFKMQPEDVMFVSNSPIADVSKVLNIITGLGLVSATPRNFGAIP